MRNVKRIIFWSLFFVLANAMLFNLAIEIKPTHKVILGTALVLFFILYNFFPNVKSGVNLRLKVLGGGIELIRTSGVFLCLQFTFYLYIFMIWKPDIALWMLLINLGISLMLTLVLMVNGFVRTFTASDQLGLVQRVCIILMWWIPILNVFVMGRVLNIVSREYSFKTRKILLNENRKELEVCRTKYPLLMVHGIFFRDWKHFNYWGRVPKELTDNGATVFYGEQESSTSVPESARQLKDRILEVIRKSGSEKVNIVAHSKGGLDSRYAISCLGMDKYVASLTTINTPHNGTSLAGNGLRVTPDKLVRFLDSKYDKLFRKLGDDSPDFFTGISELTVDNSKELNEKMKDSPNVYYRSAGAMMSESSNAVFPLSVSYMLIKNAEGDNDGLVSTESMKWGEFTEIVSNGRRDTGISHGDVIDLTRKDLPEFDVCEFYVKLVSSLKDQGY